MSEYSDSKNAHYRLLVLDSGVGGLTVCEAILKLLPNVSITYVADNAYLPYGTKAEADIIRRLDELVRHFVGQEHLDLVVVACNTASTAVLPSLRAAHEIPIVGVVPAIKPAAQQSVSKKIGLLATPATVARDYTQQLINDFAVDCEVTKVGASRLVDYAESMLVGEPASDPLVRRELEAFYADDGRPTIDTLVLGCTHFPWLIEQLRRLLPEVGLVDSSEAIARRVENLLQAKEPKSLLLAHRIFVTGRFDAANVEALKGRVAQFGMTPLETELSYDWQSK